MARKQPEKTRKTSASKKLRSTPPPTAEMERIFGTLNTRGATEQVLLGGAYLEHGLQQLLESRFVPHDEEPDLKDRLFNPSAGGVLGSFAAKVHVARAMNLIGPETYSDLMMILDIRNTFAHSLHEIDFKHPTIVEDCRKLYALKYINVFVNKSVGPLPPIDEAGQIFRWSVTGFYASFKSKMTDKASISPLSTRLAGLLFAPSIER